jgi:hypothetical protein
MTKTKIKNVAGVFLILISFLSFTIILAKATPVAKTSSSTIDVTKDHSSISYQHQRKTFYAKGRFWVFYADATGTDQVQPTTGDMKYATSTNGVDWDIYTLRPCTDGWQFSVAQQGNYVHYALTTFDVRQPLVYRRGFLSNDGTINWGQEQNVIIEATNYAYWRATIAVDSEGYPWISYSYAPSTVDYTPQFGYVTKSSRNDGIWSTANGFPYQLTSTAHEQMRTVVVPLTDSKIYVLYGISMQTMWGRLWDQNNGWGVEEVAFSNFRGSHLVTAVNDKDNIHVVYTDDTTNDIEYARRINGVWSSHEQVWNSPDDTYYDPWGIEWSGPSISIHRPTGDLYCFWVFNNQLYYNRRIASTGAWTAAVPWFYESYSFDDNYCSPSAFYEGDQYIGCAWTTGDTLGQDHFVKFAFIQFYIQPTSTPTPIPTSPPTTPAPTSTPTPTPTPALMPESSPSPTQPPERPLFLYAIVVFGIFAAISAVTFLLKKRH